MYLAAALCHSYQRVQPPRFYSYQGTTSSNSHEPGMRCWNAHHVSSIQGCNEFNAVMTCSLVMLRYSRIGETEGSSSTPDSRCPEASNLSCRSWATAAARSRDLFTPSLKPSHSVSLVLSCFIDLSFSAVIPT